MARRPLPVVTLTLDTIVGGGQALGTLPDGRKMFVWGGLPGETVEAQTTARKSRYSEGIVTRVVTPSAERIAPRDPESYLSTSPWQIMTSEAEQHYKAALIEEAFELHDIVLPDAIEVYGDDREYHYRNKVEFSWYGETDATSGVDTLHLAFFRRGSQGKIPVEGSALLPEPMVALARQLRDTLGQLGVTARQLKTLLIRCDAGGVCVWQLYVKDEDFDHAALLEALQTTAQGGEVIYSDPRSPASVITTRLASTGNTVLSDTILGTPFRYATEGFFQINLPVYEQALRDMKQWVDDTVESSSAPLLEGDVPAKDERSAHSTLGADGTSPVERPLRKDGGGGGEQDKKTRPVVDLYSGVGTIGLTIGGPGVTLVEVNEHAVREMQRNVAELGIDATPILAASEDALEHITGDKTIIVDPPRAGLHDAVVQRLLDTRPARIIYLSCNPVTQARDVARLAETYGVRAHRGYNFFPRTPHIEHLVILDKK